MMKRLLSMLLVFCMLLSMLPVTALAEESEPVQKVAMYRLYNPNTGEHFYTGSEEERDHLSSLGWHYEGVAWHMPVSGGEPIHRLFNPNNGDHHYSGSQEEIDTLVNLGWQYEGIAWNSAGEAPQYRLFNPNADCGSHHYTGSTEERDFLVSLGWHYEGIAWYGILSNDGETCQVSFYDGERLIDTLSANMNEPLGAVPGVDKSSKANAILLGYFTDPGLTQPFYADNPVTQDMSVYAKYEQMEPVEELNFTSFAQMDQAPGMTFSIKRVSGAVAPAEAATLKVMDGSDPVELSVEPNGDVYIVRAPEGFREGASYELHLAEGWVFNGKPETIRVASFSIAMKEVENLQMSDDIIYIRDDADMNYKIGAISHEVLTSNLVTEAGGTFTYREAAELEAGDILCIYVGKHPEQRENNADTLDPAIYVKVSQVSGDTVTFTALDAEDQEKLYEVPDNFPILVPALPTEATGTVNIGRLDAAMYATMMGEEEGTLEAAKTKIAAGDFLTLYVSQETITSEESLYYGRITGYDPETGEITYEKTTRQTILDSMDLYANVDIQGDDLITDAEKAELEAMLLAQVQESDFAEEAAYMMADLITKTDGFRENMNIQDFLITDENGQALSAEDIELMNLGGSFELTDDIKLTVELINKGDQLHFNGGVQLAIGVDAGFEVEVEDGDKIAIDLSATFVQEVVIDPSVKGEIVYKEILWIPVPVGVRVGATIDIKSFTALSFAAEIFTVAAEDKSTWEKLQNIAKNPAEALELDNLPGDLVKGLSTVGDVMDKIDELKDLAEKAKETNEQYQGYLEDAEALWSVVETSGLTTKEDWEAMGDALGKTSITSDLLEMMNLTNETGLNTEYYDSVQALMERYCEMVEKETDWVKLVDKTILTAEVNICGLVIGVEASFVVRADMSLAIGSNLQYQVGKRYEFWFKIGLFKPTAGSSTMDLIDEQFAFQFYVMGRLGVRAGVRAKLYVAIGSGSLASVGITAELGPYIKLYGFFVYEYTKYRAANTTNWIANERMGGALFMEFGLYFMLGFEANALGDLFEYSYDFLDEEIPLLTAGESRYYYQFDYEPAEDEMVLVRDEDNNSTTGITMQLPSHMLNLAFVDLDTGLMGYEQLENDQYNFTLSNPNFAFDRTTGQISVNVPENTRYMECDLVATYKYNKLAFSTYDMSVSIPLVWTNLSTAELSEYYSAGVRVGNDQDGYETVWTNRLLKNKEFDLPTGEEIKEMIGWNEDKYSAGTGYGNQPLTGLTLIEDEVYDFNLNYKTYTLTVTGVQNADGSTGSRTYHAKYGEAFDFSDLAETGTADYSGGVFTKFSQLIGSNADIDLNRTINGSFVDALNAGLTARADYVNNSVTATFTFTGVDHEDVTMKLRRGDVPSLDQIEQIAADAGLAVKDIYPAVGKMYASGTYQVVCGELVGPEATIAFEENGGTEVADITKVVGSLIGNLPVPEKTGYTFSGWYTDDALTAEFTETKIPEGGVTLYAKWAAQEYTVTFHVNGGNALAEEDKAKTVTYEAEYGQLPVPSRTGFGFQGWFTAETDGEQITADSVFTGTGDQTLYAQWKQLAEIPRTVFDFGEMEAFTYERGVTRESVYAFTAEDGAEYQADEFTFQYMRQGNTEYETGLPINAGTYNLTISRPADSNYAKFEQTYTGILLINKAVRPEKTIAMETIDAGYTWMELQLVNMKAPAVGLPDIVDGGVYDVSEDAEIIFNVLWADEVVYSSEPVKYVPGATSARVFDIPYSTAAFDATITILDPNYEDWTSTNSNSNSFFLLDRPTTKWTDEGNYDISWYNAEETEFTISTPAQLAGVAYLVNSGTDNFCGDTIMLSADVDLRGHEWVPIGFNGMYFEGIFDGSSRTISGVYADETGAVGVGLFGRIRSTIEITGVNTETTEILYNGGKCIIKNVVLDDAYMSGYYRVGGIAGYATVKFVGAYSIIGSGLSVDFTVIDNCASYAEVHANTDGDDNSEAGGILGRSDSNNVLVMNCVNYGNISGAQMRIAGIVGYVSVGGVTNCVNFGSVTGHSRLGGIVGTNDSSSAFIRNCYNLGDVYSARSNDYIGAICGRNTDDEGTVANNYYLAGCATGKNGKTRAALGKDGGSVEDGEKDYIASSFTTSESKLASSAGDYYGMKLIDALNTYVTNVSTLTNVTWVPGADGWPVPATHVTSNLRK